jgi:hypothetical protein
MATNVEPQKTQRVPRKKTMAFFDRKEAKDAKG